MPPREQPKTASAVLGRKQELVNRLAAIDPQKVTALSYRLSRTEDGFADSFGDSFGDSFSDSFGDSFSDGFGDAQRILSRVESMIQNLQAAGAENVTGLEIRVQGE